MITSSVQRILYNTIFPITLIVFIPKEKFVTDNNYPIEKF